MCVISLTFFCSFPSPKPLLDMSSVVARSTKLLPDTDDSGVSDPLTLGLTKQSARLSHGGPDLSWTHWL